MYVESVPNRNSPPAVLLREGHREGGKVQKRTLANLSDWPSQKVETLRRLLRDEPLVSPNDLFQTHQTLPHGHVEAVLRTIRRLGLDAAWCCTTSAEATTRSIPPRWLIAVMTAMGGPDYRSSSTAC